MGLLLPQNKSCLNHLLLPVKLPEALDKQKQILVYIHSETNCVKIMKNLGNGEKRKYVVFILFSDGDGLNKNRYQGSKLKTKKKLFKKLISNKNNISITLCEYPSYFHMRSLFTILKKLYDKNNILEFFFIFLFYIFNII